LKPGLSFRRDLRHVELGIHEQGEFERSANGQHILFRENQLGIADETEKWGKVVRAANIKAD
jgi:hypothetical protein